MNKHLLIIVILMGLISCKSYTRLGSVRNNVCKSLKHKTIVYAVFVDSDKTHPWTEYDIKSTIDSINIAINWLEKQAGKNNKEVDIQLKFALNVMRDSAVPFKGKLKYKSLSGTLFKYYDLTKGIDLVDEWADQLSKKVARSLPDDTSELILTRNKSNNRERLIAKLRNKYKTDNIALLFFINNYFENEISVALHTSSGTKTEYAVISNKKPAVIAHEFLHLFGAWDLYQSPFDKSFLAKYRKRRAMKHYPNEIMAFPYRNLDSLSISPLTKYLIGWENELQKGEGKMLIKKRWKLLKY